MPTPIPFMSGNFDDPPSSDQERADRIVRDILESSQPRSTISPSGELYRAIARYHNRQREAQDLASAYAIANTMAGNRPNSSSLEQDGDDRRRPAGEQSPLFVLPTQPSQDNITPRDRLFSRAARRGRARALGERYSTRSSAGVDEPSALSSLTDLQQLEQASNSLRALLDRPIPRLSRPSMEDLEYSSEAAHNRRVKRRKLDSDSVEPESTGFRYGRYGQVEPGKLKMEIVSCDGGIFQEHSGRNYAAENILRNDDTVYCTKSNRCNLVLRHQGGTVFSLKELVIKAPHSGYTAPVQEGMVFVSMTSDDLLTRTAQYQIQYSPPRSRHPNGERRPELPSIMSIRHNQDGSAQARVGRLYDIGLQDEECDFRTAQIPPDFTTNSQPFQVTTECSDSEEEEDPFAHNPPGQDRGGAFDSDTSDDEETHDNYLMGGPQGRRGGLSGLRRRETASDITLAEAAEASQIATQEAVTAVGGELMVPHARFFIERDKSKCTVRFDPPVSGRFILLKMWSPHHSPSGNIDVQSVIAKGYAGPRFFPSIDFR